jgi:hypothetical protein
MAPPFATRRVTAEGTPVRHARGWAIQNAGTRIADSTLLLIFLVRSCLGVNSNSVPTCTALLLMRLCRGADECWTSLDSRRFDRF